MGRLRLPAAGKLAIIMIVTCGRRGARPLYTRAAAGFYSIVIAGRRKTPLFQAGAQGS